MRIIALSITVLLVGIVTAIQLSPKVFADAKTAVCDGAGLAVGSAGCSAPTGTPDVEPTVQRGLNIFSAILGIIAVIMFMVGGLKYMTAQGDSGQLNSAKNTLIFAAVGLVIVMLAQTLVKFVVERFVK